MTNVYLTRLDSPIGRIELVGDDDGRHARSPSSATARSPTTASPNAPTTCSTTARDQLLEYFAGDRTDFDVPVRLTGTPFQQAVWAELERLRLGRGHVLRRTRRTRSASRVRPAPSAAPSARTPCPSSSDATGCSPPTAASPATRGGEGIPTKLWLLGHERIGFAA